MKRGAAPDLALVLAAEDGARARGAAAADRSAKRSPRWYRRALAGKIKRPKPRLSREEKAELFQAAKRRRAELMESRDRQADTPIPVAWRDAAELQTFLDESYDWAESKAAREVRHAKVRQVVAAKFDQLAAWADEHELGADATEYRVKVADKLRPARRYGWWAFDRITRKRYMRFRDRSGLVRLDPSESRRDTARLIQKYTPVVLERVARGERFCSAVFSMPNVPRGRLAWGKAEMFRETARWFRHFPEVTGRIEVQEDPLARDLQSWNVHNNVLLLFDPRKVTRLPPELARQGEMPLPGQLAKLPTPIERDRAPPGELSYAKAHHFWPGKQIQLRKVEAGDAEAVAKTFKEALKYAVKWVGKKQLDGDRSSDGEFGSTHDGGVGKDSGTGCEGDLAGAHLRGNSRTAPPLTAWPLDALHEWYQANKGKRRVRSFGCFYNAPKPERPDDPELVGKLRFGGRVHVSPEHFYVEAARVHYLDLIHGHKSGADFGRSTPAQARAGPDCHQGARA